MEPAYSRAYLPQHYLTILLYLPFYSPYRTLLDSRPSYTIPCSNLPTIPICIALPYYACITMYIPLSSGNSRVACRSTCRGYFR